MEHNAKPFALKQYVPNTTTFHNENNNEHYFS